MANARISYLEVVAGGAGGPGAQARISYLEVQAASGPQAITLAAGSIAVVVGLAPAQEVSLLPIVLQAGSVPVVVAIAPSELVDEPDGTPTPSPIVLQAGSAAVTVTVRPGNLFRVPLGSASDFILVVIT